MPLLPRKASVFSLALTVALLSLASLARGDGPTRAEHRRDPAHAREVRRERARIARQRTALRADTHLEDPVSDQGRHARGLYFSAPYVHLRGVRGVISVLRGTGLDAAVIDIKDDQGRVSIDTDVPELQASEAELLGDPHALVAALHAEGIYAIARIVCFNDPVIPRAHPELAVMDARPRRTGQPWVSWGTGNTWLDPSNPRNHELIQSLAVAAAEAGFDEVQLDYVRFPVDRGTDYAIFPHLPDGARHWQVIADMLRSIDEAIHVPLGVDVFGISALRVGDPAGLGQSLEDWSPYVEVFTPMLYANNFKSWTPSPGHERGASFVAAATDSVRHRLGPRAIIRPFLQGFAVGADTYDEDFVTGQIRAARANGANGFLVWNPASGYGTVARALHGPARGLLPFPGRRAGPPRP
jgi:hypothetical protein